MRLQALPSLIWGKCLFFGVLVCGYGVTDNKEFWFVMEDLP